MSSGGDASTPAGIGRFAQGAFQVSLPGNVYRLVRISPTAKTKAMQSVSEYGLFESPGQSRMN